MLKSFPQIPLKESFISPKWSKLFFKKSLYIRISLKYSLVGAGALGEYIPSSESCRPDCNYPSHRQVTKAVFFIA